MSVKFKVIQRGQPGVEGGGTKQFYASVISDGETDIEGLTRRIEKISTVSGADIRAVLYSFLSRTGFGMVDVLPDVLSNGEIARIGELGYFRISLSSTGNEKEEDVTSASVRNSRIIFTPGPRLKDMLKTLKYSKH